MDDDNVTYTITTGTATSTDAKYDGLNPPDVSGFTNDDNDDAGVAVYHTVFTPPRLEEQFAFTMKAYQQAYGQRLHYTCIAQHQRGSGIAQHGAYP